MSRTQIDAQLRSSGSGYSSGGSSGGNYGYDPYDSADPEPAAYYDSADPEPIGYYSGIPINKESNKE